MSEDGVSAERVTRAEAALRTEGDGWDGPGGGGAGMMRMESILRGVEASRLVKTGFVVDGGSDVRCSVGLG
jgi:hypothetical protein